jgi:hypothetical protein
MQDTYYCILCDACCHDVDGHLTEQFHSAALYDDKSQIPQFLFRIAMPYRDVNYKPRSRSTGAMWSDYIMFMEQVSKGNKGYVSLPINCAACVDDSPLVSLEETDESSNDMFNSMGEPSDSTLDDELDKSLDKLLDEEFDVYTHPFVWFSNLFTGTEHFYFRLAKIERILL